MNRAHKYSLAAAYDVVYAACSSVISLAPSTSIETLPTTELGIMRRQTISNLCYKVSCNLMLFPLAATNTLLKNEIRPVMIL